VLTSCERVMDNTDTVSDVLFNIASTHSPACCPRAACVPATSSIIHVPATSSTSPVPRRGPALNLIIPNSRKIVEQEVTFRCMGIRGQEIWTGPTDRPGRKHPGRPVFAASSPTPTPLRAIKFGDASLYQASIHRAMTLRAFHLRTRCPRSACKAAWLAAYASVSTLSLCQKTITTHRVHNLRGIFAAADAFAAVKFGDAPLCQAVTACATTLRTYDLRTHRPRNGVQGRLAPT
jgi:hypothetical protein